jgi:septal ring factor EnvC (AmiA/AmiB activator)
VSEAAGFGRDASCCGIGRVAHVVTRALNRTSRFLIQAIVLVLSVALLASIGVAEDKDIPAKLVKIRGDVATSERTLTQLKAEFRKLKGEEKAVSTEIDKLGFEERALVERSAQVAREKEVLVTKVRVAEEQVEQQQQRVRARLRSLYMHSANSEQGLLVSAVRSSDVERSAAYARAVRQSDDLRFREVRQAVAALIEARGKLDSSLEESQRLQSGLQGKRVELERRRGSLQEIIRQIQDKQQKAKSALAALMSEAAELEELLRSMTGGESSEASSESVDNGRVIAPGSPSPGMPVVTPQNVERPEGTARQLRDVVHPDGLFGRAVRIAAPVRGEVLQRFGKTKVADFADMIFSKGYEYKTAEGSQVKAVLGGRVAFSGEMPGYDTVVIIDHGARSYSLYGRLGKSFVSKGDVVGQRDPLGVTSAPDERGRNFYFETRKNGAPVDPSGVLARAS